MLKCDMNRMIFFFYGIAARCFLRKMPVNEGKCVYIRFVWKEFEDGKINLLILQLKKIN